MPVNDRTKATKWRVLGQRLGASKRNDAQHDCLPHRLVGDLEDGSAVVRADPGGLCTIHFSVDTVLGKLRQAASVGPWPAELAGARKGRAGTSTAVLCRSSTSCPVPGNPQGDSTLVSRRPCCLHPTFACASFFFLPSLALACLWSACTEYHTTINSAQAARKTLQGNVSKGTRTPN
jgi:hypothetical protein